MKPEKEKHFPGEEDFGGLHAHQGALLSLDTKLEPVWSLLTLAGTWLDH